ncbi:MAG: capsular polysaccharide biosynthesis protein, partial [Rubricella sp.]
AAEQRRMPLYTLEDAFLRSVRPDDPIPAGIVLDRTGIHYETDKPSDLSAMLCDPPPVQEDAAALLDLMRHYRLSKYNDRRPAAAALPDRPFTLVVDQKRGDASIPGAGADAGTFAAMLREARASGRPVVVKSHPSGAGYLEGRLPPGVQRLTGPVDPWALLEAAAEIHVVSSQMGLDAILAGRRPIVHGRAFYAGLGLSEDRVPRPGFPVLTPVQLFAILYGRYCHWFDPGTGAPTTLERSIAVLDARARAARRTARPMAVSGVRAWKRAQIGRFLSAGGASVRFLTGNRRPRDGEILVHWASGSPRPDGPAVSMEDGFIRSRGLGASLVPPLSIVLDETGIHFDATASSGFEAVARAATDLPPAALRRAKRLREAILSTGVTKYGQGGTVRPLADRVVLVPGQVSDDASLLRGRVPIDGNAGLLKAARALYPEAILAWRTHPDASAGLRRGALPAGLVAECGAIDVSDMALEALWPRVERVVTMTSTLGFEALLRGIAVTCLGWPFYAGWGLSEDRAAPLPEGRRGIALTLDQLVHAALIDYPLYLDPVTGQATAPEIVIERLASGHGGARGPVLAALSRLQGLAAPYARLWR